VSVRSPYRIHIVGISPRTGTTLLAECMAACLRIDAVEPHEASVSKLRVGARVYLTKKPVDLLAIGPRLRFDPQFHAICLVRDPRDAVVSRHGKNPARYWTPLSIWKARAPIVRRWANHARFHVLRYEDLVNDPDGSERRLREWLPFLEARQPFSAFPAVARPSAAALEALGSVRAFGADSIGNWRRHLPRVAGQLAEYGPIDDELIEFGYERDTSWRAVLEGVAPDRSASHLHDRGGQKFLRRAELTVLPWISLAALHAARTAGLRIA
jgi:hypothetical protein